MKNLNFPKMRKRMHLNNDSYEFNIYIKSAYSKKKKKIILLKQLKKGMNNKIMSIICN